MTPAVAAVVGLAIGSLPTADGIARVWGVDLRAAGSRNPGANNARRLGGWGLAGVILVIELGKGIGAVALGGLLGGDIGAMSSGVAAVAGNILNPWYRFQGGQGLGITGGVLAATWPVAITPAILLIGGLTAWWRSTERATLLTLAALTVAAAIATSRMDVIGWGVEPGSGLGWWALSLALVIAPKQINKLRRERF